MAQQPNSDYTPYPRTYRSYPTQRYPKMYPTSYDSRSHLEERSIPIVPKFKPSAQQIQNEERKQNQEIQSSKKYPKGSEHYVGFGKYKDLSWYEIANQRDFNYLNWCLATDLFTLNPTCKPHIYTALTIQSDPNARWNRKNEQVSEEDPTIIVTYETKIDKVIVLGPRVECYACDSCNTIKPKCDFTLNNKLCTRCYFKSKKMETQNQAEDVGEFQTMLQ